jgi:hypothetical protein
MQYREQKIRVRAHQIWVEEDCPDGRDIQHWERASGEIDADRQVEMRTANGVSHLPSQTKREPGESPPPSDHAPSVASGTEPPALPLSGSVPADNSQGGVDGER